MASQLPQRFLALRGRLAARPGRLCVRSMLIVLVAALASAQMYTGSIRGTVSDPTGAAVPGAEVIAKDVERNLKYSTRTDEQGRYIITSLPPARYELTAETPGFKPYAHSGFSLQVQQQATIDIALTLSDVASTVQVDDRAPLLNVTSAALGQVVENKYILSLPLAGRAPLALVMLAPGVNPVNTGSSGSGNNFVANGTRNATTDVLLDGMTLTSVSQDPGILTVRYQPSVDVVQEFKIQTNQFAAEFGNTGGAVVNMVTKSGTNEVHGAIYEFHRNAALNANSWFSNRAGRDLPAYKRNVFGGTIGGPVRIPHLYNGANRTFFFYDFEANRQDSATTTLITVPTVREKAGDFSDTRAANGRVITIYNPFDTYTAPDGRILRRPFAGNIVPPSMHSSVARRSLAYYPDPNQEGAPFTRVNNYFNQGVNHYEGNQTDLKIDHNISDKQRFSSRYSLTWDLGLPASLWPENKIPGEEVNGNSRNRVHNFVYNHTYVQSPSTLLSLNYGVMRIFGEVLPKAYGFDPTSLGFPKLLLSNSEKSLQFPYFEPEGYRVLGTFGWKLVARGSDVNNLMGSVSHIAGAHNIKTGVHAQYSRYNYNQPGYPQGNFRFSRITTSEDRNRSDANQGNAIASWLLGWGSGGQYDIDPPTSSMSTYYGFFVQDDWKITRRLTINVGLRYDFDAPRTERFNRYSWFDPDAPSPLAGKVPGLPNLRGAFAFASPDQRSPMDGDYNNFQPRIGFAYALNGRTSLRAGYGLFYTTSKATAHGRGGAAFWSRTNVEFSRDGNITQFATLENPFPAGLTYPTGSADGAATYLGLGGFTADTRANQNPQIQSWNMSVQRELPGSMVLEANYTGSKGTHLYFAGTQGQNRLSRQYWDMGRTELAKLVPNPFYGVVTDSRSRLSQPTVTRSTLLMTYPQYPNGVGFETPESRSNSIYHAVQFRLEKRFSRGLSALAHYTISKLIDDSSWSGGGLSFLGGTTGGPQDLDNNLRIERSLSSNDIPQRAVLTFTYEMPFGRGKSIGSSMGRVADLLAGGWEVNGMFTFQSGFPIAPALQGGMLWSGTQRPHLVGDPSISGPVVDRLASYLNPAAFQRPAVDVVGTAPRTLNYRTPGTRNADMSLLKGVRLTEAKSLQFRLETFNTTNTPGFGAPDATFGGTSFGVISGYAGGKGARQVQVAVKFYY